MQRFKFRYWHLGVIALLILVAFSWAAANWEWEIPQPFNFMYRIAAPIQQGTTWVIETIDDFRVFVLEYRVFQEEKRYYQERLAQLERERDMVWEVYRENQRLRELLGFQHRTVHRTLGAEVIGYSGDNWDQSLYINRGEQDGVALRQPVITYRGYLVGQVVELQSRSAKVQMITHPQAVVGGIVAREESRDLGVVRGNPLQPGVFLMDNFSWDADIEPGDEIVTSGMSEFFPKGIPIGEIQFVEEGDYGLTQTAGITPYIHGITIEEVQVIVGEWGVEE